VSISVKSVISVISVKIRILVWTHSWFYSHKWILLPRGDHSRNRLSSSLYRITRDETVTREIGSSIMETMRSVLSKVLASISRKRRIFSSGGCTSSFPSVKLVLKMELFTLFQTSCHSRANLRMYGISKENGDKEERNNVSYRKGEGQRGATVPG